MVKKNKVIAAKEAANLIKDGQTLGIQGIITASAPIDLMRAVRDRFLEEGRPKGITVFEVSGIGDGKEGGINMFAHEGLIGKLICGHIGTGPKLFPLIAANKFPAFIVPQGIQLQLCRATGAKMPGVISAVGLKTYADPRLEGCKANQAAKESKDDVVDLVNLYGKEYLFYKARPIDVCFIKATTADVDGNLSIEKEGVRLSSLEMAMAARSSGGIVIAQVERLTEAHTIKPHAVVVPGVMVDYIVLASEEGKRQFFGVPEFHPEWCGETRLPLGHGVRPMKLCDRKIIGRRAALELRSGDVVNLGIGMPEAVAAVAAEEGISSAISLTMEAGSFGGVPQGGLAITAAANVEAIISHADMFIFYDGGGLDLAVLGAAQIDRKGNVNVSKFAGRTVGPGGFVNITQSARNIVFASAFAVGECKEEIKEGKIKIIEDGKTSRFVEEVEQVTLSGEYANESNKNVLYVTDRAVFKLTAAGLELIEIAPGVNLAEHIFCKMAFKPLVAKNLKTMDMRIFREQTMGLKI
jgi:propionate CoA-transferase